MGLMTPSERSKTVAVNVGWINYQKMILGVSESQIDPNVPKEFTEIFMIGYALGEERAEKRLRKANRGQ